MMIPDLHRKIDHTRLSIRTSEKEVLNLCQEATENDFFAVVVNPVWVKLAAEKLASSRPKVCSVVGFPLGANRTETKISEAALAVNDGAVEIDMVANIGWLISDRLAVVEDEIRQVRDNLPEQVVLKVIVEAGELTLSQQIAATRAVVNGGAQFVKTGTGFGGQVTTDQVRALCQAAGGQIQVKAAGGIISVEQCHDLILAGASRLGSSSSVKIMAELNQPRP